ncbi:hypothetical protein OXX80_004278 [Metschnikowia pulcherrima]
MIAIDFVLVPLCMTLFGVVRAQSIIGAFTEDSIGPSNFHNLVPTNDLHESRDDNLQSEPGFRVVIRYEKPSNCLVLAKEPEIFLTETEYVTRTMTTDIYITKKPADHREDLNEKDENDACTTCTLGTADHAHETDGFNENEKSEHPYYESGTHNPGNGKIALQILEKLGRASTKTLLEEGPTSAVKYISTPTPVSMTRRNPLLQLKTVDGPNAIRINESSFPPPVSAGTRVVRNAPPYVTGGNTSNETDAPVNKDLFSGAKSLAGTEEILSYTWNQSQIISQNASDATNSRQANLSNATSSELSGTTDGSNITEASNITEWLSSADVSNTTHDGVTLHLESRVSAAEPVCSVVEDLFQRISNVDPESFYEGKAHPYNIPPGVSNDLPYETNKFYTNLFNTTMGLTAYTWPYEVYWDVDEYHGLAVSYPNPQRKSFDGMGANGAKRVFMNGLKAPGVFIGAASIRPDHYYTSVSHMRQMSVNAKISPEIDQTTNFIEYPLVEGMGLVTSIYHGQLVAKVKGNGGISKFEEVKFADKLDNKLMYRITVGTGETWIVLATLPKPHKSFELKVEEAEQSLVASEAVDGLILQVALAPSAEDDASQALYYETAGQYVIEAKLSGTANCGRVDYQIGYETNSDSGVPLIFALPHHNALFDPKMEKRASKIYMPSTTKGMMQGYLTRELLFSHEIDTNVQWMPYIKGRATTLTYTADQIELIKKAAIDELKDVDIKSSLLSYSSQYKMGKAVDKYAYLMYVLHDVVKAERLADEVLLSLKAYFLSYREHESKPALFYDTKLKGVTSEAAFEGEGYDYGSGYYNDHNFHYSYIIHAAALVGHLDSMKGGTWAKENEEFINTLVRDVANPSEKDEFFPVFRSFDWFQGHSWAHGITGVPDGKDLESTSEDVHFSYAMKLWGKVIGDKSMEARGDLMLKIQTESFGEYFLYEDDNKVVPSELLRNKVTGIFFENKIDYATWFGSRPEYIHGIQMIPVTPALGSVRSATFAQQEWSQILDKIVYEKEDLPWKGILNSNRVLFDPSASWSYFANPNFNYLSDMDGGQSRAWALAYAAPFMNQEMTVPIS